MVVRARRSARAAGEAKQPPQLWRRQWQAAAAAAYRTAKQRRLDLIDAIHGFGAPNALVDHVCALLHDVNRLTELAVVGVLGPRVIDEISQQQSAIAKRAHRRGCHAPAA